jgi:hypothetical protein
MQQPVKPRTHHPSRITHHASRITHHRFTITFTFHVLLLLLLLLLLALAVRLLAVRQIDTALWVDAGRHALITAVMVESGQTISHYAPFLA